MTPAYCEQAIQHLVRIIAAKPSHLRATVDLHFHCAMLNGNQLSDRARVHFIPEVRAHYLRCIHAHLPDTAEFALERGVVNMLQGDFVLAMLEMTIARQNHQRLGAATHVLMDRSAISDLDILTD